MDSKAYEKTIIMLCEHLIEMNTACVEYLDELDKCRKQHEETKARLERYVQRYGEIDDVCVLSRAKLTTDFQETINRIKQ